MITFVKNIFNNFRAYSFLMSQMIGRDFKVKYKRSVLGIVWSLLYPVLMMAVMAVVFSQVFRMNIEGISNYLVYLLSGLIIFNYFSEATNSAMTSVVSNFQLMNKVYMPKYIFPLSKCLFSGINFLLSLIPLLLVVIITGAPITWLYVFLPYVFVCIFLFALGVGLFLATVSVFLRDVFYIYGIVVLIWQYFTPLFYDINMFDNQTIVAILRLNPLYHYLSFARTILIDGQMPSGLTFLTCGVSALVTVIIGGIIFKAKQDKFIYYA